MKYDGKMEILGEFFLDSLKSALLVAACGTLGLYGQNDAKQPAPNGACPPNAKIRVFGLKDSGETVDGPVCVTVRFNGLRYSSDLGRTTTTTAGPDLPAAVGAGFTVIEAKKAPPSLAEQLIELRGQWNRNQAANGRATRTVAAAIDALKSLVNQSDDLFRANGAGGVMQAARESHLRASMQSAARAEWESADELQASLKDLDLAVSKQLLSNPSDADKANLTAIRTDLATVLTDLVPSLAGGAKAVDFDKQKAIVQYWNRIIGGLDAASFERSTYVTCSVSVNQNKQIAVKLFTADRLPSFDSQPVVLSDTKDSFVTVNCPSPFVVSAGVEMRFLKTSTFGLVPSGASGANQFGITDNQDRILLPVVLAHVRLAEGSSHHYAVFGTFGVSAHSQGSGTGGSAAEYLAGFSLGLFRTMFVTAGVHFGKVSALSGGYKVGDPVPAGVTTPPVTGSYSAGFGLAFTFTKP